MRALAFCLAVAVVGAPVQSPTPRTISLRGHEQTLRLYGRAGGQPVIVSSGDGGWIHLAPHIAEFLAQRGFTVVGFDAKAYLSSFTSGRTGLGPRDVPGDYRALFDGMGAARKPILVGVSEGAGLSVLAATGPDTRIRIRGIVGVGLPDVSELGWRWTDSMTYLTHRLPNEPTFSVAAVVGTIAPVPIAAIHSTHDEYVPLATVERVLAAATSPRRLWVVNAADHRFSDNLSEFDRRLLEAIDWIEENGSL